MDDTAVERLLEKHSSLERQRDRLSAMRPGVFCLHRTFGFGEIVEYDDVASRIIVNFHEKPRHAIDPVFALKHLAVLGEDHLLVRFRKDPASVKALLRDDPAAALRSVLEQFPSNRATQAEIGDVLLQIMNEKALKTWWARAKKEAQFDPNIAEPEQRGGYYVLRMEPLEQVDELLDGVLIAKQLPKKIQAATKLLSDAKFCEHRDKMSAAYDELLRQQTASSASAVEKLQLFWLCEDFAKVLEVPLPGDVLLGDALRSTDELTDVANLLPVGQLPRLFAAIRELHGENYFQTALAFVRSCGGRAVSCAVDFIVKNGDGDELRRVLQSLLREGSMRAPLLDWIIRNRKNRRYGDLLGHLVGPALFRAAMTAIDHEALRRSTNRKIPLAEAIAGDSDFVDEVLADERQEMARDLAQMVLANQGFDSLTKRSIVARFIRHHPGLQKLLDGALDSGYGGSGEDGVLKVSQESLSAATSEYERLVTVRIPENTAAVEAAREEGDLRENSMYKMARQEQDMLLALKMQMEKDLLRAQVVDFSAASDEIVTIGSAVMLADGKGKKEQIVVLGAWDSNPEKKIISYLTPLGRNMLGKRRGESVSVDGKASRVIADIKRWVDVGGK
ncbi:MAG: GreA/GreB family elongation factor [Puniceicoccales bacterium]|jgi:transcription elongation GreA/GreB family factor|nr:GreA/GreB family elongation factor [Puniceicoccales bacterium]